MDINDIFRIMDRFEASSLTSLDIEIGGAKLSVKKDLEGGGFKNKVYKNNEPIKEEINNEPLKNEEGFQIKSPLVGTFYRSPSPEEPPFVVVGGKVKKGDIIGIVEAMKLMNEVASPVDGEVISIEAVDGEIVSYNEVLITVKEIKN